MSPTLEFHDISFRLNVQEREEEGIWLYVFSRILKIYTPRKASFYHFPPEKLALLTLVKEATPSPDRKMIKLPTFDNLFPNLVPGRFSLACFGGGASKSREKRSGDEVACFRHFDVLAKIRSRVTTAITFSRQNDAGSHASIT